jgi:LmbE family N-acetylglucosaminyl deacetylase
VKRPGLPRLIAAGALFCLPGSAQLSPLPYDQGAMGLGLALRRLPVAARVLYVTAHPDDEHNGVLVRLARGQGLRTALLTLTRGDGGQNAIGPELFEAIGVLRTEELMAVHRFDGVEQYFTRAYEFGYSFSTEETFAKWGREETLGDVVRVVRFFRPDVILTLPLEAPGGGQHHQAAAQLARDAFRAAADPARFPEQLRAGLRPWQARKIYQGGVGGGRQRLPGEPVTLKTAVYDPLLGMTWQELGSMARAMHKCQGTSQLKQPPGEGDGTYFLVDSEPPAPANESDVTDGVDASLEGWLGHLGGPPDRASWLAGEVNGLLGDFAEASRAFDPHAPYRCRPALLRALGRLRAARARLSETDLPPAVVQELRERLVLKEAQVVEALVLAQGLVVEADSSDDQVVRGQKFTVTVNAWNQGGEALELEEMAVQAPAGWSVEKTSTAPPSLGPGGRATAAFSVKVGAQARYSQPYWRRDPARDRFLLDRPEHEGRPWSPPEVTAALRFRAGGESFPVEVPARWRYEGRWVGGEKQKVVNVVPAVAVRLLPEIAVVPAGLAGARREFRVAVTNGSKEGGEAVVRLVPPAGFAAEPARATVRFRHEGEEATVRFALVARGRPGPGEGAVRAVVTRDGNEHVEDVQLIAYDHIQERRLLRPAQARLLVLPVSVRPGVRVGYVPGSGDTTESALRQLGVDVRVLGADDLAEGDLGGLSTIVLGIRAYETRADLRAQHHRLMAWVERGGHLVVQYNRAAFNVLSEPPRGVGPPASRPERLDSPFAPYPASVTPERITDENAPMTAAAPAHPLLLAPNRIGPDDWKGWVQERGIQFLEARDPRYLEILAGRDPFPNNPGDKRGILVEAKVGRGTWTYVGLGLFRQLPAGTAGAYRLLANLVSRPPPAGSPPRARAR